MNIEKLLRRFRSAYVTFSSFLRSARRWNRNKVVGVVILAKSDSKIVIRLTQMCINSLVKLNTTPLKVVVVESGDPVVYRNAEVISPNIPFAYNEFMCIGIEYLRKTYNPDFFLLMNNDIAGLPGAIDHMVCCGLASASPVDPTGEEQSSICRPTKGYSIRYHVVGWALFIRADLISAYGSDGLFPHEIRFYWQDWYYADFLKHHGVIHYVLPKARMIHLESASTTPEVSELMESNGDYQIYLSKLKSL